MQMQQNHPVTYPPTQFVYGVPSIASIPAKPRFCCCASRTFVLTFLVLGMILTLVTFGTIPILLQGGIASGLSVGLIIGSGVATLLGSTFAFVPMVKNNIRYIRRSRVVYAAAQLMSMIMGTGSTILLYRTISENEMDKQQTDFDMQNVAVIKPAIASRVVVTLVLTLIIVFNMSKHCKYLENMRGVVVNKV